MSFWRRGKQSPDADGPDLEISGRARVDGRTKRLCRRLRPGEIAVIDHRDLDLAAAQALVQLKPAAVVNCAASISGRYPTRGPAYLLEEGIPLLDQAGSALMERVVEGDRLTLRGEELYRDGEAVGRGHLLSLEDAERLAKEARANISNELRRFSANTLQFIETESQRFFEDLRVPPLDVQIDGRPVLVVARGPGFQRDLRRVLHFIREQRPVLIAVDGGADALLQAGYRPHLIVGDMDSASDESLRSGAQLLLHTYLDGRPSPSSVRLGALGVEYSELPAPGTSEDVAMLLAHQLGTTLIVAVGTRFSLEEFLDKDRAGMSSTFITRLKVGSILVDAKGVDQLYRAALSPGWIAALLGSGVLVLGVIALHSPWAQRWLSVIGVSIELWLRRHGLG